MILWLGAVTAVDTVFHVKRLVRSRPGKAGVFSGPLG